MNNKSYSCRHALECDIESVARIHLEAFSGFFLSELGYKFLCLMYRAFLLNHASIFIVHESKSGCVSGFAVGTLGAKKKDRWLALRYLPQFFVAALPAIFQRPFYLVRCLGVRFFESSSSLDMPTDAAMLRSIGVLISERGGGAAFALLEAFERIAYERGAKQVYLTTDGNDNERAQNFYKRHGYFVVKSFQQDSKRLMWLMSKNIRRVSNE